MAPLRIAILGAATLALAWVLLASRNTTPAPAAEAVGGPFGGASTIPRDHDRPAAVDDHTGAPVSPVAVAPAVAVDNAIVAPQPPAPERAVRADSPYPSGGKPVAPVDLAWDIAVATDGSRAFHGTIAVTTRSGPARIAATLTGVGGAVVTGATAFAFPSVAAGQRLDLPVAGLAAAGPAGGITVTVTYATSDTRGRAVRIDLRDPAMAAKRPPAPEPDAGAGPAKPPADPLRGTHIVTDDAGGRTILQPSSPPPRR